jgi:glycosyltransferase XagB
LHFRGLVPLMAHLGLAPPLGGTSNHFLKAALNDVGGWDPFNVTEDADIGYRLAAHGWTIGVIEPSTWEEAPNETWAWIRQRSRWLKGYAQTWLLLMRDPAGAWKRMGGAVFCCSQFVLAGAVLSALAYLPATSYALFELCAGRTHPGAFAVLAISWAGATMGGVAVGSSRKSWRIGLAGVLTPVYWLLAFIAACWAIKDLCLRPHHWLKTEHGSTRTKRTLTWAQ